MIQRDIPLSEVMRRLHEINQREEDIASDHVRNGVAFVAIGLFLGFFFIAVAIIMTRAEQEELRRPQIVRVQR
jgi:hypothetical protein